MDSKLPSYENDEGPAPPSYLDSVLSTSPMISKTPRHSTCYSSQIQTQLNHLSTQLRSIQTQRTLLAHAQEDKFLSLLTSHIQIYLSEFANTGFKKGTLILIPAHCLADKKAQPLDFHGEDKSSYDVFVEVGDKESPNVNGAGEGVCFWEDEEMAGRLAGALRPFPELPSSEPGARKQPDTVVSQGGGSSRFWRKKSSSKNAGKPALVEDTKVALAVAEPRDRVVMDVKAEEVCLNMRILLVFWRRREDMAL